MRLKQLSVPQKWDRLLKKGKRRGHTLTVLFLPQTLVVPYTKATPEPQAPPVEKENPVETISTLSVLNSLCQAIILILLNPWVLQGNLGSSITSNMWWRKGRGLNQQHMDLGRARSYLQCQVVMTTDSFTPLENKVIGIFWPGNSTVCWYAWFQSSNEEFC